MNYYQPDLLDPKKDEITPTKRRAAGPRMQRRKDQRREKRKRSAGFTFLVVVVSAAIIAAITYLGPITARKKAKEQAAKKPTVSTQETWLLIGTVEGDQSSTSNWLSVMAWEKKKKEGFIMFVPRTTLVEIPGHGGAPEPVAKALSLGREPLQLSTLSNLLGIKFDHYLRISDQGIQALFDKTEGLDLDIGQRLTRQEPDGKVRVVFAEGQQHLDGKRVAEYLTFLDETGDEISRGVRHATVWGALLSKYRAQNRSDGFAKLFLDAKDLYTTDARPAEIQRFFLPFPSTDQDEIVFETLPVQAQGVDTGTQFYKADAESVQRLVSTHLSGSKAAKAGEPGRRVQILNGNGVPGIGQEVADRLLPKGFRIVLDANAKRFDYDVTQIVIYSDSAKARSIADEVRESLGVGEVLISRQRQSVVDVTIVVGRDYLKVKR